MQKSGAGLHTANSCFWDTATDGETQPPIRAGITLNHLIPVTTQYLT